MRTSSILVPCLIHGDVSVWDTLAIAEYLNEFFPDADMLPRGKSRPRALPLDLPARCIPASPPCAPRCR